MASKPCSDTINNNMCRRTAISLVGSSYFPTQYRTGGMLNFTHKGRANSGRIISHRASPFIGVGFHGLVTKKVTIVPKCINSSNSNDGEVSSVKQDKKPFGYSRKDVLLIGLGVTVAGIGLKNGLEFFGVDPLQAGNVVQLVLVLGLTVGWISTYIFRVSNKEMTYAQQLRDYESKVMEKRLESLTEAELEMLLEQVEEEKGRQITGEQAK